MKEIIKKELSLLSKAELIDYIKNTFHSEIITLFSEIKNLYKKIKEVSYENEESNYSLLNELLKQFNFELNEHVKREHEKYFDFLLKVEKKWIYDIDLFDTITNVETAEHTELKTYIISIIKILEKLSKNNNNDNYILLISKMNDFYDLILKTIMYEEYLIEKVRVEISEVIIKDS